MRYESESCVSNLAVFPPTAVLVTALNLALGRGLYVESGEGRQLHG